jgi:hypothetical protein
LLSRAKVICQDQKNFKGKIRKIKYDVMFKGYPQDFNDSIIKPERNNNPSNRTYHGRVVIPLCYLCQKNFEALGTAARLGPFSKLNMVT